MDAVSERKVNVWFGGCYREQWSENYILSIIYENRRCVEAVPGEGGWLPAGGDEELCKQLLSPDCPALMREYFQAAATVYDAVRECLRAGLKRDRLAEFLHGEANPLAAPELMRLLMDDCGFPLIEAYRVTASCCLDLRAASVQPQELYQYQPRTAHVVSVLRQTAGSVPALSYDSRRAEFRSPGGALEGGSTLRLAFRRLGGTVKSAHLELWGDNMEHSCSMENDGDIYYVNFTLSEEPQALWYAFYIETDHSAQWLCPDATGYTGRMCSSRESGFRLTVYKKGFETPAWFRKRVMYQIFPDRFAFSNDGTAEAGIEYHKRLGQTPELHASLDEPVRWQPRSWEKSYSPDDFYGGTLKGIEQKLPYLKELGIGVVYLNPIVEARSNHRYDTSDYSRPDPILGTMEDFEHLCAEGEKQGIRFILDGVYSHTGADSRYFNRCGNYGTDGACQGQDSEFYSWYDFRHFPDDYRCWWGFKDLPEVNEQNPKWQDDIVTGDRSIVKHWLRHGAAGWRLDVADELPDAILALIRDAAKSVKPDAPIIGEVWEDAVTKESYGSRRNYALGYSLDSVMNYPLRSAVLSFMHGWSDAYGLRDFLISQQMNYPKPLYYSLMNLLGSHDVDRLRTALAADRNLRELSREDQLKYEFSEGALSRALQQERLCAAIQFAIPGVPSIYYGDEQGMCGVCDPFNRLPFKEGERELHDWYARLANMRNSADAFSTGHAQFMAATQDVLLILRWISDGHDAFGDAAENGAYLAVINRGAAEVHYRADCSAAGCGTVEGTAEPVSAKIIRIT